MRLVSFAKSVFIGVLLGSTILVAPANAISTNTETVTPVDMKSWLFYNDETDVVDNSLGSFVAGPAVPPLGQDSVQISVTGTQRRNLATYQFSGTPLADITDLKYSTFNPLVGNGAGVGSQRSGYLHFNVDFNGTDTWQRRLVFVPADNGTVQQDTWQEWNAINNGNALWKYSGTTWPNTGQPGTSTKTWNQILTDYPGARIRVTDAFLGIRVGEPYANGYTENIDKFVLGVNHDVTVFDFENARTPLSKESCKKDNWMSFNTPTFKNQGDCVSFVASKGKAGGNPVVNFLKSIF